MPIDKKKYKQYRREMLLICTAKRIHYTIRPFKHLQKKKYFIHQKYTGTTDCMPNLNTVSGKCKIKKKIEREKEIHKTDKKR